MPHPRYLGRSTSFDMSERLKLNIPPNTYRLAGEPKDVRPTDRSLEAFRRKVRIPFFENLVIVGLILPRLSSFN